MVLSNKKLNITAKKKQKESDLFSAGYELFIKRGIEKTSIDDIVKKAGVAKGTFYLYFKDKYDLLDQLILKQSNKLIKEALDKTNSINQVDFKERTLCFIDYLINYFKENEPLLKLINKNISWGLYRKAMMKPKEYEEVKIVIDTFVKNLVDNGMDIQEAELTLFMIIELVGSVCFTTIILKEPVDIEVIKPVLFKKIVSMISV